jgi:hypothetical protein
VSQDTDRNAQMMYMNGLAAQQSAARLGQFPPAPRTADELVKALQKRHAELKEAAEKADVEAKAATARRDGWLEELARVEKILEADGSGPKAG